MLWASCSKRGLMFIFNFESAAKNFSNSATFQMSWRHDHQHSRRRMVSETNCPDTKKTWQRTVITRESSYGSLINIKTRDIDPYRVKQTFWFNQSIVTGSDKDTNQRTSSISHFFFNSWETVNHIWSNRVTRTIARTPTNQPEIKWNIKKDYFGILFIMPSSHHYISCMEFSALVHMMSTFFAVSFIHLCSSLIGLPMEDGNSLLSPSSKLDS